MAVQRDAGDRPAGLASADDPAGSVAAGPASESSGSADSAMPGAESAGRPVSESGGLPASAPAGLADLRSGGSDEVLGHSRATLSAGTGEPRVDAALRRLDELDHRPVPEHPAVFEHVHARLSEVLGELDSGPADGPPGQGG